MGIACSALEQKNTDKPASESKDDTEDDDAKDLAEPTPDESYNVRRSVPSHQMRETNTHTIHYPDHPPRKDTPLYRRTHRQLCITQDLPCFICGKTRKRDKVVTETHHFFCEKAAEGAIDWIRFGERAAQFTNPQTNVLIGPLFDWTQVARKPETFVDSIHNMVVLCPEHHRSAARGIHHIPYPEWQLQATAREGFTFLTA